MPLREDKGTVGHGGASHSEIEKTHEKASDVPRGGRAFCPPRCVSYAVPGGVIRRDHLEDCRPRIRYRPAPSPETPVSVTSKSVHSNIARVGKPAGISEKGRRCGVGVLTDSATATSLKSLPSTSAGKPVFQGEIRKSFCEAEVGKPRGTRSLRFPRAAMRSPRTASKGFGTSETSAAG